MTTLEERVARALHAVDESAEYADVPRRDGDGARWTFYLELARAAIAAVRDAERSHSPRLG